MLLRTIVEGLERAFDMHEAVYEIIGPQSRDCRVYCNTQIVQTCKSVIESNRRRRYGLCKYQAFCYAESDGWGVS